MSAYSNTELLLKEISRILGVDLNGRKCIGEQVLSLTDNSTVKTLTIPDTAQSALIIAEAGASPANSSKIVRFYESGTTPTTSNGYVLGDLDTYEVVNLTNLQNFKVIGLDAAVTHKLQILYYA